MTRYGFDIHGFLRVFSWDVGPTGARVELDIPLNFLDPCLSNLSPLVR